MTLLHADGFSLYGTGATSRTNLVQGVWAQVDTVTACESSNPRGAGTHHLRLGNTSTDFVRRVLGGTYSEVGIGAAHFFTALPAANDRMTLCQLRDNSNLPQCSINLRSTGDIEIRRGAHDSATILGATSSPPVTAGAYQHIEMIVTVDTVAGAIEVRVDGLTVLNLTGLNTANTGVAGAAQYVIGNLSGTGNSPAVWDMADIHAFNTLGTDHNDFLGDVQWLTWYPTSDQAASDWTRNAGANDFECIDDTVPDGDTTYVEATLAGQISEYGLTNVPANTSDIIAVITQPMQRKTDAGAGTVQTSMLSADIGSPLAPAESNGAAIPLTETYTFYPEVHPADPATGVRWTPSSFNAARLRLDRTV